MDLLLTDEQRQVRELCRDFADAELRPNARRWDEQALAAIRLAAAFN